MRQEADRAQPDGYKGGMMRKPLTRVLAAASIVGVVLVLSAGAALAEPALVVTPDSGLSDGDTVMIEATGYTPGIGLGINLCADQDDPDNDMDSTGGGDCNLGGIVPVDADDEGNVSAEFTVIAGPFGENQRTCDADHDCVISVGELTADADAERATVKISFAAVGTTDGDVEAVAVTGELAATGTTTAPLLFVALGLLVSGAGIVALASRRRTPLTSR